MFVEIIVVLSQLQCDAILDAILRKRASPIPWRGTGAGGLPPGVVGESILLSHAAVKQAATSMHRPSRIRT